jgi:hypothetical protein
MRVANMTERANREHAFATWHHQVPPVGCHLYMHHPLERPLSEIREGLSLPVGKAAPISVSVTAVGVASQFELGRPSSSVMVTPTSFSA